MKILFSVLPKVAFLPPTILVSLASGIPHSVVSALFVVAVTGIFEDPDTMFSGALQHVCEIPPLNPHCDSRTNCAAALLPLFALFICCNISGQFFKLTQYPATLFGVLHVRSPRNLEAVFEYSSKKYPQIIRWATACQTT